MPGLIIDDAVFDVPGIDIRNWRDDPILRLEPGDRRPRNTRWVRSIFLHTTKGDEPILVLPGRGPSAGAGEKVSSFWSTSEDHSGAHIVIDHDGMVSCLADLQTEAAYHATTVNDVSIGVEIYQGSRLEIYEYQVDVAVHLANFICRTFEIWRQYHKPFRNNNPVPRLAIGGKDCVGVFGHRDQTDRRGRGDPGDYVFSRLEAAGYMALDFAADEDLSMWKGAQKQANKWMSNLTVDGIPGPATVDAMKTLSITGKNWAVPGGRPF